MGSYVSCMLRACKPTKAKLFDTQGRLQHLELPITAAEIMLEEPGNVVCALEEIKRSRRVWALRADEGLEAGKFYLMLPAARVQSKVSEVEMSVFESACRKRSMVVGPKVFPEKAGEEVKVKVVLEDGENGFPGRKLGKFQQWRPMLEPIHEAF